MRSRARRGDAPVGVRVEARSVTKRYGRGPQVLDRLDLVVRPAEIVVVAGANGSGKSTMLRLLAGVSVPTGGHVLIARSTSIGFAPERLTTVLWMSVRDYLAHVGRMRGLDHGRSRSDAVELCARLGLEPGLDTPVRELSKGNNQKVALAQALLAPVDLLVLDEPHAGLDAAARIELDGMLAERAGNGAAVVLSAHRPVHLDARRLRLAGGRLSDEARAHHAHLRIVVRRPDGDPRGPDLRVTGSMIVGDTDGRWEVRTPRDGSDRVLLGLLRDGWSIDLVEPWSPA